MTFGGRTVINRVRSDEDYRLIEVPVTKSASKLKKFLEDLTVLEFLFGPARWWESRPETVTGPCNTFRCATKDRQVGDESVHYPDDSFFESRI
jgi:hypothetical protein